MALYVATQAVVMGIYITAAATPPYLLAALTLSKRLHSIFVLRLFNDGWAMLVAYVALLLLMHHRATAAIVAFAVAVGIKMNVLLFAPGVLVVCLMVSFPFLPACFHTLPSLGCVWQRCEVGTVAVEARFTCCYSHEMFSAGPVPIGNANHCLQSASIGKVALGIAAGMAFHLATAAPFLLHAPAAYFERAFEFSR